jgi:hypothetical protein
MLIAKARERASGAGDNCTLAIIKLNQVPTESKQYSAQKMHRAV